MGLLKMGGGRVGFAKTRVCNGVTCLYVLYYTRIISSDYSRAYLLLKGRLAAGRVVCYK